MQNRDMPDGGRITERLHRFADYVAAESPLYSSICHGIAADPTVLDILAHAPHGQPAANIILAGVHFLLLGGVEHELANWYPTVAGSNEPPVGDPVRVFVDFCDQHRGPLTEIAATRTVQTNEVRRCTTLLPAFQTIDADRPLALLEIGPSAGLNLLFDRYAYDYGGDSLLGNLESPLVLTCETEGQPPPPRPLPPVAWRRGIDLQPLDVMDPADVRWGKSLLWPGQMDRVTRYEAAVALAQTDPPRLVAGDALELLPEVISAVPDDLVLVVFHSYVLNQFTEEARRQLTDLLVAASQRRPIDRIAIEMLSRGAEHPEIVHTRFDEQGQTTTILGAAHHHGAWLRWDS